MASFLYQGKSLYYEAFGRGRPVVFLHGNTASSRMFEPLLPLYTERFRCVLLDFLGNGRSERVEEFSPDLWQEEARQVIALAAHLRCGPVGLIGTSGGAWAAINAALERPDLVFGVVADSFDGRTLHEGFAEQMLAERRAAKQDAAARGFYEWCQGPDWEAVVDRDTQALVRCARERRPLFARPLSGLQPPILLLGSWRDEMCRADLREEYQALAAEFPRASVHLFEEGGHPAVFSNAERAAERIGAFLAAAGPEEAP